MTTKAAIKKRFFDALKRGTGEAYLIAKSNPSIDFSAHIIRGALKNYAFDGQSEGDRAQYIFDLIMISTKKGKIREAILYGLATEQENTWSLTQLFALAKLFAQQGYPEAREAIYDRFLNHPIKYSDWAGADEILELDGLDGLFYIAEAYGKIIDSNPDEVQDNGLILRFQDNNPDIDVDQELERAANLNKYIQLYLDNIERGEQDYESYKAELPEPQWFNNIVDEVIQGKWYLPFDRVKALNDMDLKSIAERLISEKDIKNKEKLLSVFRYRAFPLDGEFILNLANQRHTSKNRINEFTVTAMKLLKGKRIRASALEMIPKSKHPEVFAGIFIHNFRKGDGKHLADIARRTVNVDRIHRLAGCCIDIFKANATQECQEPLELLYDKMNCGQCRHEVIKLLIDNGVLSGRLKSEIEFDSYLETRELFKGIEESR